jgi:transcriptional regulator with XRE-family HTH domain
MADMKWSPRAWARLGVQIRKSREQQGYSRKKLAERSGVSEKSIQLTEEGRVPTRWPKSLHLLEDALGWGSGTVMDVLDGGEVTYAVPTTPSRMETLGGSSHAWFDLTRHDQPDPNSRDYGQPDLTSRDYAEVDIDRLRASIGASKGPVLGMAGTTLPLLRSARDIELTQSGHLAQDVFMRQAARYRKMRGVSVEQLAKKLAGREPVLEEGDISCLENGTRLLKMAEANAIAAALETTVDWLLGSGFNSDAPEEMRRPPSDKELEAEVNAVMRRMADMGAQLNAARQQADAAAEREAIARAEAHMARAMVQSVATQQGEMEKHYQYLLGRIDSIRAARGEETAIQIVPVYEGDENRAREDDLEGPPFTE